MSLPGLNSACRLVVAIALSSALAVSGWAQDSTQSTPQAPSATPQSTPAEAPQPQQFQLQDYAKPRSHFPNPIAPYTARHLPPPNLSNTPRIDQLMQDGKLMISMDDAIALALENNLDIGIARYNLNIADTDILRAKAGASILGVNAGVVQNTPGAGVGGLGSQVGSGSGGTSAGAGGAGTGTGGIVGSTLGLGPLITSFDPVLTGTLQWDHADQLSGSVFSVPVVAQNTQTYNFSYGQGFQSGTNMSVGFNNSRVTNNSPFSTLSPQLNSGFQFRLTQHLLQGLGLAANDRFIRRLPPASYQHGGSDREYVLGPSLCLRKRKGAKGIVGLCPEDILRHSETGADWQPCAHRSGARPKHRSHRHASPDCGSDQSAVTAVAHEECAQPHPG
jgi:hypothetical protein